MRISIISASITTTTIITMKMKMTIHTIKIALLANEFCTMDHPLQLRRNRMSLHQSITIQSLRSNVFA
ncbi:hypothetical protein pipiens_012700 [Culex pipiens pipiens]|uniref:Uncharacterized protein n=1 Tax=Culex pipiens pipiens TaxID=38569 RepID=A0ABD1D1A7_CULPP